LNFALWNTSHDELNEKVKDLLVVEDFCGFPANLAKHQVSLLVLERVVKTVLRDLLETLYEGLNFVDAGLWDGKHRSSVQWINHIFVLFSSFPFALDEVHTFVGR
jgi:hypothetical protein